MKKTKGPAARKGASYDIVIIGGGPAGLCCAAALDPLGLSTLVIERQAENTLARPHEDGRDIALTHASRASMERLGLWQRIPSREISPIREARVMNGDSAFFLQFSENREDLGWLVPNHLIRKAAYETAKKCRNAALRCAMGVKSVRTLQGHADVTLEDGSKIRARLVIAADSRFSSTRPRMGIAAEMRDFGRSVVVFRVQHEKDHGQTAFECFHYGQTLAVLPLNGRQSSIVITLPTRDLPHVLEMTPDALARDVAARFGHALGKMKVVSERHSYPLVAVYADTFHSRRFALMGDAAVGMHPVTAHGFNFGLEGAMTLAAEIGAAAERGIDFAAEGVLERYSRKHRRATRPLYLATNALVALYTNDRPLARVLRGAILRLGQALMPARKLIVGKLTEKKSA